MGFDFYQNWNKKYNAYSDVEAEREETMKKQAVIQQGRCVSCGACTKVCPKGALSIYRGCYAVVGDACVGCGLCAKTCPADCISIKAKEAVG